MNALPDMARLCRETCQALGLDDGDALAEGRPVAVGGVLVALHHGEGLSCPVVVAEIGAAAPEQALDVYRRLLQVQLMSADQADLRFGLNPFRDTVVLSQAVRWGPAGAQAAALAAIMKATAAQAGEWRDSLLLPDAADVLDTPDEPDAFHGPDPMCHALRA
jgi:hypothetical protein